MELVEFWRARRALLWYLAIVAAITVFTEFVAGHATFHIDVDERAVAAPRVFPLSGLLGLAMFFTAFLASSLGLGLNRENETAQISWTRPIPRAVLATRFIGIDLVALLVGFIASVAGEWLIVSTVAKRAVILDPFAGTVAFLALGVVAMWYALVLVLSAGVQGRGNAIAWLLWPVSLVLVTLSETIGDGSVHTVVSVLNVFNPFAYLSTMVHTGYPRGPIPSVWTLDPSIRTLIVWLLAGAFCAAGVAIWQRREI